jgi:hypothetical protein
MSDVNLYQQVAISLNKELDIKEGQYMTEDEILHILIERVDDLLKHDKDLLLSYLYRLDISQKKIATVLRVTNIIPPEQSLARLILDRQIERIKTKQKYKQDPIEGWEF